MKPHACTRSLTAALALLSLLAASTLLAQSAPRLTLFPAVESRAVASPDSPAVITAMPAVPGTTAFVLVGTSQIGERQRARLRNAAGETISVELSAQGATPLPGYPGFEVTRVNERELVLQHPPSSPCLANQNQGVSCLASNQARLTLATAAPVVRQITQDQYGSGNNSNGSGDSNSEQNPNGEVVAESPFAAALRAARQRGEQVDPAVFRNADERARFRPRRIDPADVPPGAQLIRTPFGDRIVTQ